MSFQFFNHQITFYLFTTSWCQIKFYPLVDIFCTLYHLSANKYLNIGTRNSNLDLSRKGGRAAIDNYTFCLSFFNVVIAIFSFNPDPKVRNTFWTLTIGGAFTAMPVWTVSQTAVQRFLAIRTLKDAKR